MNRQARWRWLVAALALVLAPAVLSAPRVIAFSFDDLEKVEKEEQADLLRLARQAAESYDFSKSRSFLEQAKNKGYAPKQIAETEAVYKKSYAAYEEKQRAKEAALKAERERERNRQASQRSSSSKRRIVSGLGGGGFSGKCKYGDGIYDVASYDVGFNDGSYGSVKVRCNQGCWGVSVYPGGEASNCGNFDEGSFAGPGGRWLNKYHPSLSDVTDFILGN